jgi:hypothetical protein
MSASVLHSWIALLPIVNCKRIFFMREFIYVLHPSSYQTHHPYPLLPCSHLAYFLIEFFFMNEFMNLGVKLSKIQDPNQIPRWPEQLTTRLSGSVPSSFIRGSHRLTPVSARESLPRAFPVINRNRPVTTNPYNSCDRSSIQSRGSRTQFRKCLMELKLRINRTRKALATRKSQDSSSSFLSIIDRFRANRRNNSCVILRRNFHLQ